jgi:hypothetical protein
MDGWMDGCCMDMTFFSLDSCSLANGHQEWKNPLRNQRSRHRNGRAHFKNGIALSPSGGCILWFGIVDFEYNRKFYVGLYDQRFGQVDPEKKLSIVSL